MWAARERFTSIRVGFAGWLSLGRRDTAVRLSLSLPWERPWWPNLVVSQEIAWIQREFLELACPLPCGQLWVHALFLSSGPPNHSEAWLPRTCKAGGLHLVHLCGITGECWVKIPCHLGLLYMWGSWTAGDEGSALPLGALFTFQFEFAEARSPCKQIPSACRDSSPAWAGSPCAWVSALRTSRLSKPLGLAMQRVRRRHAEGSAPCCWTLELTPPANTPPAAAGSKTCRHTTLPLLLSWEKLTWNQFASCYTLCMCRQLGELLPSSCVALLGQRWAIRGANAAGGPGHPGGLSPAPGVGSHASSAA